MEKDGGDHPFPNLTKPFYEKITLLFNETKINSNLVKG
jgi:hypothetical protein